MDNKKKFFIGLGILLVVYIAVIGLNLTHKNESNKNDPYSKEKVMSMLDNGGGTLQSFFSIAEDVKDIFSFLLPKIDLFNDQQVTVSSGTCELNDKEQRLTLTGNGQCILLIKESDDSSRSFSFIYNRQEKSKSSRGVNKFNSKKLMLANAKAIQPQVMVGTIKWNNSKKPSANNNDDKFLSLALKDSKKNEITDFSPMENDKKEEIIIAEKYDKIILKCLICEKYDIHIRQNEDN